MTDETNDLVYRLRHGSRHETAQEIQDEAAHEIESLDEELSVIYAARARYLASWVKWLDERKDVPITRWLVEYSEQEVCPNPDGNEIVERVIDLVDLRMKQAISALTTLARERDEARAEVCLLRVSSTNATPEIYAEYQAYAQSRGWHELTEGNSDE